MDRQLVEQPGVPMVQGSSQVSVNGSMPTPQELMVYETWAKNAADSQMYRNVGKESGIMMIMLAAREYGIGPAQALNGGLHIIEGKVELSARVMLGLIRRAKHIISILEDTDEKCVVYGKRTDTGEEHTVTYTIEMAQKGGLIKEKGAWKKTPEDMLFNRAVSRLARRLFTDVIGIGYVEGEISCLTPSNEPFNGIIDVDVLEDENELLQELLKNFEEADHFLLAQFITSIHQNFNTSKIHVIRCFIKDLKTASQKFHSWKNQRKLDEK